MLPDLNTKDVDVESLAQQALDDAGVLSELVRGLSDKQERVGYNCLKILLLVAEERPELLYPHWDLFVELLRSDNTYFCLRGANLIAAIADADTENRFELIFDEYYGLLDGRTVTAAAHIVRNSGKLATANPGLRDEITARLLSIDHTHHPPERRDLIKGYAIEAFGEYFEESEDQDEILAFVREQLQSKSPKTRKLAKEFLKRWGETS